MSIRMYYTSAEAYDEPDTDMLFKVECVDGDIFTVDIKTHLSRDNVREVLDAVRDTILGMS